MKYALGIVFSFFVLIMNMQNGLHLLVYEVAKPIIIKNYCENVDEPALKCDGKCHLRKVIAEDNSVNTQNDPTNIPPPKVKIKCIDFFIPTVVDNEDNGSVLFASSFNLFEEHYISNEIRDDIFRPPIF